LDRQRIIAEIYESKDFNAALGKMQPDHLRDELRQEVILVLCEMPEDRLIEMYNTGGIKFYLVRTMINMCMSKTSRFYAMFRREQVQFDDNHERIDETDIDSKLFTESVVSSIERMAEWDNCNTDEFVCSNIMKAYMQHGNIRATAKAIDIPPVAVHRYLKRGQQIIREKIKKH
jgi:hypothetical protein